MTFERWKHEVVAEFAKVTGWSDEDAAEYVRQCGDTGWREMFDADLCPETAAREEHWALCVSS